MCFRHAVHPDSGAVFSQITRAVAYGAVQAGRRAQTAEFTFVVIFSSHHDGVRRDAQCDEQFKESIAGQLVYNVLKLHPVMVDRQAIRGATQAVPVHQLIIG